MNKSDRIEKSGKYVKALRKKSGLTQINFAAKLGIAQSNVSELELDKRDISLSKFIQYCNILGIKDYNEILLK